jgi:preprotein translocase subunit SecG
MIFTFLLVVQVVVAFVLVTLILMQRSEGGGLGVGGSSSGLMTARGQADFLTRATGFTAVAFVGLSILLAGLATQRQHGSAFESDLAPVTESEAPATAPAAPADGATSAVDNDILGSIAGQSEASDAAAPAEDGAAE